MNLICKHLTQHEKCRILMNDIFDSSTLNVRLMKVYDTYASQTTGICKSWWARFCSHGPTWMHNFQRYNLIPEGGPSLLMKGCLLFKSQTIAVIARERKWNPHNYIQIFHRKHWWSWLPIKVKIWNTSTTKISSCISKISNSSKIKQITSSHGRNSLCMNSTYSVPHIEWYNLSSVE